MNKDGVRRARTVGRGGEEGRREGEGEGESEGGMNVGETKVEEARAEGGGSQGGEVPNALRRLRANGGNQADGRAATLEESPDRLRCTLRGQLG